jgi:ankyrin repeat protein
MRFKVALLFLTSLFLLPTAFAQSAETARDEALRQLTQKQLDFDEGAFIKSVKAGDLEAVRLFLKAGMNPDARDEDNVTALALSIRKGHQDIMLALIDNGSRVNEKFGDDNDTPLMVAAGCGRAEVVEALLNKGAKIEAKDNGGHTALLVAVFGSLTVNASDDFLKAMGAELEDSKQCLDTSGNGHLQVIRMLINRGANVNIRATDRGETPLCVAATFGDVELVKLLLAHGADVNQAAWDGDTILKWLKNVDAARNDPETKNEKALLEWLEATAAGRAEVVRLLKQAGAKR